MHSVRTVELFNIDRCYLGFSLGGNILTKYLGEVGESTVLQGAICISNPFDLVKGSQHLEQFLYRNTYSRIFARNTLRFAMRYLLIYQYSHLIQTRENTEDKPAG